MEVRFFADDAEERAIVIRAAEALEALRRERMAKAGLVDGRAVFDGAKLDAAEPPAEVKSEYGVAPLTTKFAIGGYSKLMVSPPKPVAAEFVADVYPVPDPVISQAAFAAALESGLGTNHPAGPVKDFISLFRAEAQRIGAPAALNILREKFGVSRATEVPENQQANLIGELRAAPTANA